MSRDSRAARTREKERERERERERHEHSTGGSVLRAPVSREIKICSDTEKGHKSKF